MRSRHPRRMINEAIKDNSLPQLITALEIVKANPLSNNYLEQLLPSVLGQCIRHGSVDLVRYLLEHEKAPMTFVSPLAISGNPSIALLELLLTHGWDINQAEDLGPLGQNRKLIDFVCNDGQLIRWLVQHGARVTDGEVDNYELFPQPAPLLETCAVRGSVASFRYLQAKGALLGKRTLHRAVGEASAFGTNPFIDAQEGLGAETCCQAEDGESRGDARARRERAEMLIFLVDEMKLDVNAMDSDFPNRAYRWGTPLCYAAVKEKGADVIRWLLEKRAQPTIKTAQDVTDAEELANAMKCGENARILGEWKQAHGWNE
ncbi:hypothetical protein BGZ61DRAFT_359088 [Ilyonectria robusta]|uniref:uncharacterized protein n=1 Tax=Ilyonectria robusta TaxID=1079257 RepID=UPI001E8DEE04|nr:uncharacterized protein BGZ61DRAFT_359088 [Ilyonectria robusta]KAH8680432.1 hypothetical protein BGZ61DRAFT_359088 [Ilyonectria robusta]